MNNLPTSFSSNTFDRMVHFLDESNQIESIKEVDYRHFSNQIFGQGHFGALVDSQQMAVNREPLTIRKIRYWQAFLTEEQKRFSHHIEDAEIGHIRSHDLPKNVRVGSHIPPDYSRVPILLDYLVEQINEGLQDQGKLTDDAEYCKFLGRSFQKFEEIHPFCDGNGRTGRLLANYIATYCGRPIIVFNSEMIEKNEYYRAHVSSEEMARFMAKKVQDAIFGLNNQILFRANDSKGATVLYQSATDPKYQEKYQWHSLNPILYPESKQEVEEDAK